MIEAARDLTPLDIAALTLHHEAGGEGVAGMVALAAVLRNRLAWGKWGTTIEAVCLAPKQFSCWSPAGGQKNYENLCRHADMIRSGRRPKVMERAYAVAEQMLADVLPDPTNGADHYYAPKAMQPPGRVPQWALGRIPTAKIGGHVFYRLRPLSA